MNIFEIISAQTFWKILLFFHFLMAVALLGAVTLQTVAILMPVRQVADNFIHRFSPLPAVSYATMIVVLYVVTMGLALLPAYWYFWQQPQSEEQAGVRKAVTIFLAFTIWYAFLIGHVANDFRGVGS
jgi:hypothetical protein